MPDIRKTPLDASSSADSLSSEIAAIGASMEAGFEPVLLLEANESAAAEFIESIEGPMSFPLAVTRVACFTQAKALAKEIDFTIVFLDMDMPESAGLRAVLSVGKINKCTPIAVLASRENKDAALDAIRMGAQDFLLKSQLNSKALERVIAHAIHRKALRRQSAALSYTDVLSGGGDRIYLYERWARMVERAKDTGSHLGVMSIGLGNFDDVRTEYGVSAGQSLLIDIFKSLKCSVYNTDMVARLGDDDFVVIVENIANIDDLLAMKAHIANVLGESFAYEGQMIDYEIKVGCTLSSSTSNETLVAAISRADEDNQITPIALCGAG